MVSCCWNAKIENCLQSGWRFSAFQQNVLNSSRTGFLCIFIHLTSRLSGLGTLGQGVGSKHYPRKPGCGSTYRWPVFIATVSTSEYQNCVVHTRTIMMEDVHYIWSPWYEKAVHEGAQGWALSGIEHEKFVFLKYCKWVQILETPTCKRPSSGPSTGGLQGALMVLG